MIKGPKFGNDQLWKIDGLFWVENKYGKFHVCKNLVGQQVLEVVNSDVNWNDKGQSMIDDGVRTTIKKVNPNTFHFKCVESFDPRCNTLSGAYANSKMRAVMTKENRRTGDTIVMSGTGVRRNEHIMKCTNLDSLKVHKPTSRL